MSRIKRPSQIVLTIAAIAWPAMGNADSPTQFSPPEDARILFRDVTLIDGSGRPPQMKMDVLVAGERIEKVFPDNEFDTKIVGPAKVIELRGSFLIPGLIDSHVHLATPPNRRQAEAVLRRNLYGGVTAVRDMADDLRAVGDLARASLVGEIAAPDIYYAALMAGPNFFTDPRTVLTSTGGEPGHVPWMQAVTDQTDLPLAVAQARGTFATAIKLYADLSPALAARITAEAHRQHMLIWAHATLYPAKPSDVVAAGVDALSHACLLVREPQAQVPAWGLPRAPVPMAPFRDGRNPALARLFTEMARRGTILDATIWTYHADTAGSPSSSTIPSVSCDDVVGGAIAGQAHRAGVSIAAGTDTISDWTDQWPDLFRELDALADRAGMPLATVIRSATLIGARAAGQERDMGSIEPGKLANMVVLARDPLSSLQNLKSVVMTVKRGRVFERKAFVPLQEGDIADR